MDKTVRINVDGSEAGRVQASIRRDSEQLAREMIRSSRQYSTSAKEVLSDIEEQIRAIEKRNKLDQEFNRVRLESLRTSGGISDKQFSTQSANLATENRQDELQTRLLRELIDTVKTTSKEEVREDRRNIENIVGKSTSVGRLGVSGDEFSALKETVQQDLISEMNRREGVQSGGFNLGGAFGKFSSYGNMAAQGNIHGLAMGAGGEAIGMMAGRGILAGGGAMGGGAIAATGIGAIIIAAIVAAFAGEKKLLKDARDYAISTQTRGLSQMGSARDRFRGVDYEMMGMGTIEAMNMYASMNKSAGGGLSESLTPSLIAMTRSRDISPELLNQVISLQRYSGSGNAGLTVASFEQALSKKFGTGDEFRRKLVQLPEMIGVYNTLAQQMLQTTGSVNSTAISNFVGGISTGFGVEGQNLQRYAGGLMKGMSTSDNNFLRKMQFASIRQAYGDVGYQKSLEILEDPTANKEYMRFMYSNMQRVGLPAFRSWVTKSMGLGVKEAGEMFSSKEEFETALSSMGSKGNKTIPSQQDILSNYMKNAEGFYSKQEQFEEKMIEFFQNILTKFGMFTLEENITNGAVKAHKIVVTPGGINAAGLVPKLFD